MASVIEDPGGRKRIQFVAADGSRKTVRLGKASKRDASDVGRHVEALLVARINGQPRPRETAVWLGEIGDALHDRLARSGLIEGRVKNTPRLAGFIDDYVSNRADLKPSTVALMKQARTWLIRFLGEDRRVDQVTAADADAYRANMIRSGLAKATVNKRLRYAKVFFKAAIRARLVEACPFSHIPAQVAGDPARRCFVPAEVVARVVDVAPDPQWKLLIALARWGGLRIPSEALALTWQDVDFAGRRFIVRASKTEHHADGGVRVVPMFPELVPLFHAVFDDAPEGTTYVITRYRSPSANLRTQFQRYIEKAGAKPWPKLWQNLRASRATELADQFPSHVCASWLGHTERIADAFYRQVTDEHFARATAGGAEPDKETAAKTFEKAAQNPAQQATEMARKATQPDPVKNEKSPDMQRVSAACKKLPNAALGRTGLEPVTPSVSCWYSSQLS